MWRGKKFEEGGSATRRVWCVGKVPYVTRSGCVGSGLRGRWVGVCDV